MALRIILFMGIENDSPNELQFKAFSNNQAANHFEEKHPDWLKTKITVNSRYRSVFRKEDN